jgi:SnoaL-like domain
VNDLERRIDRIEARTAVSELRSTYCWYITRGFGKDIAALFTDDGVFQNVRGGVGGQPKIVSGKAALQENFARIQPAMRIPLIMNEVIRIDRNAATGTCAMVAFGDETFSGHYYDEFRRENGRWLFSRREYYTYWPVFMPSPDLQHPYR